MSATPSSGLCTRCPTPHIRGPRHSSPHGATTMEARWRMTSNRRKIRNKCERCNVWAHFVRGTRWCHWFSPARPGNTRTRCDESVTKLNRQNNHHQGPKSQPINLGSRYQTVGKMNSGTIHLSRHLGNGCYPFLMLAARYYPTSDSKKGCYPSLLLAKGYIPICTHQAGVLPMPKTQAWVLTPLQLANLGATPPQTCKRGVLPHPNLQAWVLTHLNLQGSL